MMTNKICLGTVQFGQDYGVANTEGQVSKQEAFKILDYAQSVGIELLDTALSYGKSEDVLGDYIKENKTAFRIITKLAQVKEYQKGCVDRALEQSLHRLNVNKIYGYLLHNFEDLHKDDLWDEVNGLKSGGKIQKIGFSLYKPQELEYLLNQNIAFDIVQLPYSLFDRRFEKYFLVLKNKNIEIHARSIFLQGAFFLNPDDLPSALNSLKPKLESVKAIADGQNLTVESLCLNFVLSNLDIDKVLIGVDNLAQLKRNIDGLECEPMVKRLADQLDSVKVENEDVLLPYNWQLSK